MDKKEYRVHVSVEGGGEFYMRGAVDSEGKTYIKDFTEVEVETILAFIKGLDPVLQFLNNPPAPHVSVRSSSEAR